MHLESSEWLMIYLLGISVVVEAVFAMQSVEEFRLPWKRPTPCLIFDEVLEYQNCSSLDYSPLSEHVTGPEWVMFSKKNGSMITSQTYATPQQTVTFGKSNGIS
ncbi:hypothetical protein NPIL_533651 [Nephila pilipes]|uniref:Uncharacterized protein n=1 Tax=Nephila pilipes TaxID=299642 RepID=A0A8X6QF54_NEPPI|nr:hypothetical protein NPIL_533651 [Nephila pilipes]